MITKLVMHYEYFARYEARYEARNAPVWRWGAPLGRVAWSRLDPCTGSGTVLIGSIPLSTLNAQPPELKRGLMTRAQGAAVS